MLTTVKQLAKHLNTTWPHYVLPEADNRDTIVLHRFDDVWVAFEKSAYFLYHCCDNASPMIGRVNGYPFPLVMCIVPQQDLTVNSSKAHYRDSAYRQRIFNTDIRLTNYPEWLREKIDNYHECHTSLWYIEPRTTTFFHESTPHPRNK